MPRYILHQPKSSASSPDGDVPVGLRSDERVEIISEMPRLLLVDCTADVADEWLAQMPGWKKQIERHAQVPDPRPKLK
jgi:hypothetical protein